MEQMRNSTAPTVKEVRYIDIICSLFRRKGSPEIFLGTTRGNTEPVYCFRVNEDGSIKSRSDIVTLCPTEMVEILSCKDLRMGRKVRWAD